MTDADPPPLRDPAEPAKPQPSRLAGPLAMGVGASIGLMLWLMITLFTGNMALGLLFGLAPGIAIGAGLQWTARK